MKDPDFKWITAGGTGGLDYENIVIINPKHADTEQVIKDFKLENKGVKLFGSVNLLK